MPNPCAPRVGVRIKSVHNKRSTAGLTKQKLEGWPDDWYETKQVNTEQALSWIIAWPQGWDMQPRPRLMWLAA